MRCPTCQSSWTQVLRSRSIVDDNGDDCIKRLRKCKRCGGRFTTYENYESADTEAIFSLRAIKETLTKVLNSITL